MLPLSIVAKAHSQSVNTLSYEIKLLTVNYLCDINCINIKGSSLHGVIHVYFIVNTIFFKKIRFCN